MLDHEDHIEEHGHIPQPELDRIARNTAPITLHSTVEHNLSYAENATAKVEKDSVDCPAGR